MNDPIIKEIRKNRKQIEKNCGNDWKSLGQYFCDLQSKHNVKTYSGKPKKILKNKAS